MDKKPGQMCGSMLAGDLDRPRPHGADTSTNS
jgi:hypothetical protein